MNGANRLLRRGLDRGYLEIEEELRSPHGRVLIDRTIKEQTLKRAALYCSIDELRRDVVHNQIIKATANFLAREKDVQPALAHELRLIYKKMADVSDVRLTPSLFRRVQLSRNNAQYALLMRLCEFIYQAALPEERGSGSRFPDILRNEERMSVIFEDFLRNFYDREQSRFEVGREHMRWRIETSLNGDASLVPEMRTDVTLRSPDAIIVMDAKFYADPFPKSSGKAKFRSAHLYQLFAYMKHAGDKVGDPSVRGALVYASPSDGAVFGYRMDGHEIAVAAIDLKEPWQKIHAGLMTLLEQLGS